MDVVFTVDRKFWMERMRKFWGWGCSSVAELPTYHEQGPGFKFNPQHHEGQCMSE